MSRQFPKMRLNTAAKAIAQAKRVAKRRAARKAARAQSKAIKKPKRIFLAAATKPEPRMPWEFRCRASWDIRSRAHDLWHAHNNAKRGNTSWASL